MKALEMPSLENRISVCSYCKRRYGSDGEGIDGTELDTYTVLVSHGCCRECFRREVGEDPDAEEF